MKLGDRVMMCWEVIARSEGEAQLKNVPPDLGTVIAMADFGERAVTKVAACVYENGEIRIIDRERAVVYEECPVENLRGHVAIIPLDIRERLGARGQPPLTRRVPRPKTRCSACGLAQYNAPDGSGVTCANGHGGAEGIT